MPKMTPNTPSNYPPIEFPPGYKFEELKQKVRDAERILDEGRTKIPTQYALGCVGCRLVDPSLNPIEPMRQRIIKATPQTATEVGRDVELFMNIELARQEVAAQGLCDGRKVPEPLHAEIIESPTVAALSLSPDEIAELMSQRQQACGIHNTHPQLREQFGNRE